MAHYTFGKVSRCPYEGTDYPCFLCTTPEEYEEKMKLFDIKRQLANAVDQIRAVNKQRDLKVRLDDLEDELNNVDS